MARRARPLFWGYLFVKWWLAIALAFALFVTWAQNQFAPAWLQSFGDAVEQVMNTRPYPYAVITAALLLAVVNAIRARPTAETPAP